MSCPKETVLLVGGTTGIGFEILKKLLKEGYNVSLLFHNQNNVQKLESLKITYPNFLFKSIDLADINQNTQSSLMEFLKDTKTIFSSIEHLVLNSGLALEKQVQDHTLEENLQVMNVNFLGHSLITSLCVPYLLKSPANNKSITAISSIWGLYGAAMESLYSASKGALIAFINSLCKELGPSGIRANTICPGPFNTKILECYSESDLEEIKKSIPVNKLGNPEDISSLLVFLIKNGTYISGNHLVIDGGFTL